MGEGFTPELFFIERNRDFFCQRTKELRWLHEHPTVFKIPSFSKGHRLLALSSLILMDSCEVYTCLKTCKLYQATKKFLFQMNKTSTFKELIENIVILS